MSRTFADDGAPTVPLVSCVEPTIDVTKPRVYAVKRGGAYVQYTEQVSSSWSNSTAQWSLMSPGLNNIIDRQIFIKVPVKFTFTAATPDPLARPLQIGWADAPRAFPIHRSISALNVKINGNASPSIQIGAMIDQLQRVNMSMNRRNHALSLTPVMPDFQRQYSDVKNLDQAGGFARSPMAYYGQVESEVTRGGFPYDSITGNAVGDPTAVVNYTFVEPLLIPPLSMLGEVAGLANIQTLEVQIQWDPKFGSGATMWSHDSVNGNSTLTCVATMADTAPSLLTRYVEIPSFIQVPRYCLYPYQDVQTYPSTEKVLNGIGRVTTFTSPVIEFECLPTRLMFAVRLADASRTMNTTDTFIRCAGITLLLNNKPYLANITPQQLYNMSRKNGSDQSWSGFQQYEGSLLVIDVASDIGVSDPLAAPGAIGRTPLQVTFQAYNQLDSGDPTLAMPRVLYITRVLDGTMSVSISNASVLYGPWSQRALLDSEFAIPEIDYHEAHTQVYGGDWFSRISNSALGKFAGQAAKWAWKNRQPIAEVARTLMGRGDQEVEASDDKVLIGDNSRSTQGVERGTRTTYDRADTDLHQNGGMHGGGQREEVDISEVDHLVPRSIMKRRPSLEDVQRGVRFADLQGGQCYDAKDLIESHNSVQDKLARGVVSRGAGLTATRRNADRYETSPMLARNPTTVRGGSLTSTPLPAKRRDMAAERRRNQQLGEELFG